MDTADLHLFVQAYESRSFSAAAKKVFMSPQGVAKSVAKLEAELAVPLFERHHSGITPTAYGYHLYQRAQEIAAIFDDIQHTDAQVRPLHREVVNVFATMGYLDMLGFDFFAPFYQAHPEIILNLVEFPDSALQQRLADHQTNLAFTAGVDFDAFDGHFMQTNAYAVIMAPTNPLAKAEALTAAMLAGVPQALMGREFAVMNRHIEAARRSGQHELTDRALETGNVNYIIEFARRDYGVGILQRVRLTQPPLRELLATGALVTRPTAFPLDRDVFFISRDASQLTAGEKKLKAYILAKQPHLPAQI